MALGAAWDEGTCKGGANSVLVQELRPLVYPLCQIIVGAVKLKPTARYYTLHLRLLRSLIRLGGATRVLMPVVPMLLDMLKWAALSKRTSAGANPAQQGPFLLRASKAVLVTSAFQADILQQVPYPAQDCTAGFRSILAVNQTLAAQEFSITILPTRASTVEGCCLWRNASLCA